MNNDIKFLQISPYQETSMRPFLSVKHMQCWHEICESASKIFIEELNSIKDDRELAIILSFTAKICERIDSFQSANSLKIPKAASWFTVVWSWLKRNKTI